MKNEKHKRKRKKGIYNKNDNITYDIVVFICIKNPKGNYIWIIII